MPASFSRGMSAGLRSRRGISYHRGGAGDVKETSRARDRRAFREQLPDEGAAACAERGADGELAPPRCGAREHQARDIAHAISRTRATAAISSHKVCRAGPTMKSSSGVTMMRKVERSMRN